MNELLQFVITGITVGMVYSLIALGFVLVWKSSGVANLALGQLVLLFSTTKRLQGFLAVLDTVIPIRKMRSTLYWLRIIRLLQ